MRLVLYCLLFKTDYNLCAVFEPPVLYVATLWTRGLLDVEAAVSCCWLKYRRSQISAQLSSAILSTGVPTVQITVLDITVAASKGCNTVRQSGQEKSGRPLRAERGASQRRRGLSWQHFSLHSNVGNWLITYPPSIISG